MVRSQLKKNCLKGLEFEPVFLPESQDLIVKIDARYSKFIYDGFNIVYGVIDSAIGKAHPFETKMAVLKMHYKNILFFPMVQGRAFSNRVWKLGLHDFQKGGIDDMSPGRWIDSPIDIDYHEGLGIKSWETVLPELRKPIQFYRSFGELYLSTLRLGGLNELNEKIEDDTIGAEIIGQFVQDWNVTGNKAFHECHTSILDERNEFYDSNTQVEDLPFAKREMLAISGEVWQGLLPPGIDLAKGAQTIDLKLKDLINWNKSLEEVSLQVLEVYLWWIQSIIDGEELGQ